MITCKKCGTEILEGTSAAEEQICIPCQDKSPLFDNPSKNIRHFKKRLSARVVDLSKLSQSSAYADYKVTSTLRDNDPRFRSRNIVVGSATGILRIDKQTGEIFVVYPLSFDHDDKVLSMAKEFLSEAFARGEFPEEMGWAMS